MNKKHKPTEAELDILNILWEEGPKSVRYIHEKLTMKKDIYYTTTLKTMQVMHDKGLLNRDTSSRSHIYSANVPKKTIQRDLVSKLKKNLFGDSAGQLVISALGHNRPSKEELEQIKSIIEKLEDNNE